ncbi:unnamed protein product [Symbiodinium sp. KB8]|nr:unnamed protein product [Symbiodinium sp. KB8]
MASEDIDVLRGAQTIADFQSRCATIKAKWDAGIVSAPTAWLDKGKQERNFPEYFMTQWATQVPEWYIGASNAAIAPSTNNGAESCVKNTRIDAGNVVASIGEVVAFLLSQVEAVSSNKFDASAVRVTPRAIWHRAAAFSSHIGTQLVRKVDQDGQPWYVCSPRKDPTGEDVGNRKVLSMAAQQVLSKPFVRSAEASALQGHHGQAACTVHWRRGCRVFGILNQVAFCTCPAFYHPRRCFHTLGLEVYLGRMKLPEELDTTPVGMAARGNKPKAPGRYAVPLRSDAKDVRIAQLEAQLRKLRKQGATVPLAADTHDITGTGCSQPTRRIRRKTADQAVAQVADALGGPVEDVPSGLHETCCATADKGQFPITSRAQQAQFIQGEPWKVCIVPKSLMEALRWGYVHPDVAAPAGLVWGQAASGHLVLSARGG